MFGCEITTSKVFATLGAICFIAHACLNPDSLSETGFLFFIIAFLGAF